MLGHKLAVFTADIIREDKSGLGVKRAQCKQKLPRRLVWSKNARNWGKKLIDLTDIRVVYLLAWVFHNNPGLAVLVQQTLKRTVVL